MNKLTSSLEDYLEAVSIIEKQNGFASVSMISIFLKVKKPSVNQALNLLRKKKLINYGLNAQ